jgi:hypothetical protein
MYNELLIATKKRFQCFKREYPDEIQRTQQHVLATLIHTHKAVTIYRLL